ncbi:MAG: LysM peptidoglycan-binding domain-containing protein [Methylobacter sp.]|nr:LysM peptidoglycan-binding domain-containing protein [Methylobacter sp.]
MNVNFSKSVNLLFILISLIASGCSETNRAPLKLNDRPPIISKQDSSYARHPYRPFPKQKLKAKLTHNDTVWDRLLSLYSLPPIENERIDRELNWYLQNPDALIALQQRAEPYLHLILDEIEAKNIPGELALLPVIESSFIPDAYSKSQASGLWQFIPATGRLFGLQQNSWYDGRRDVYASTKAATTYLKQLSETFDGDWLLALASYNFGKGNIRKCIEKNEDLDLPTDYWSLSLPEETFNYVPRLLAIAKLFANAEQYNIPLQHIPNKPYFEVVDIKAPLDLNKAAAMANIPLKDFLKLNPGFNRWCTAPEGPHRLLIPVQQAQFFKTNLAQLSYADRLNPDRYYKESVAQVQKEDKVDVITNNKAVARPSYYKVKSGESLLSIATRNRTTIKSLRQANHLAGNTVRTGMLLEVPSLKKSADISSIARASRNKSGNAQIYVVKKGDTFWKIAQKFSVSSKNIADWNKISLKTALVPGRKLSIKALDPQLATASSTIRLIHYTVHKGDSLLQISRKFNVPLTDLRKSNANTLIKGLQPGQKLKVLVDNSQPST